MVNLLAQPSGKFRAAIGNAESGWYGISVARFAHRALLPAAVLALGGAAGAAGCVKEIQDPRTGQVDFGNPKSVTASIFYAADTGETAHLASLCDPQGENDRNTARICALTLDSADWQPFREAFARARLNGEPRISGDRAALHFVFGPTQKQSETMELIRRDGRWYLLAF